LPFTPFSSPPRFLNLLVFLLFFLHPPPSSLSLLTLSCVSHSLLSLSFSFSLFIHQPPLPDMDMLQTGPSKKQPALVLSKLSSKRALEEEADEDEASPGKRARGNPTPATTKAPVVVVAVRSSVETPAPSANTYPNTTYPPTYPPTYPQTYPPAYAQAYYPPPGAGVATPSAPVSTPYTNADANSFRYDPYSQQSQAQPQPFLWAPNPSQSMRPLHAMRPMMAPPLMAPPSQNMRPPAGGRGMPQMPQMPQIPNMRPPFPYGPPTR
jgi:hypothetical protein